MGVDFDILILMLDAEREITIEKKIKLLNSIITSEPLYLTGTGIDKKRD